MLAGRNNGLHTVKTVVKTSNTPHYLQSNATNAQEVHIEVLRLKTFIFDTYNIFYNIILEFLLTS
jgi:hypothetical protein